MFLSISGFLCDAAEDDTLKYALTVNSRHETAVLRILGWKSLDQGPDGEWLLTPEQVAQIAEILDEKLPTELDLFIGISS